MTRHPQTEDSTLIAVAEVLSMTAGSYLATVWDRVCRALPDPVVYAVTLVVSVAYGLTERTERDGGAS